MIRAPKKILAIKLRSLGDTILMTAPLMELRNVFPDARIEVAVTSAWASLLENHPGVQRVWTYERHPERAARAKAAASLALKLRKEHFDCVVNFHASPSSAMISFATAAPVRSIHFHGHNSKNRYSTVTVPGKGTLKPIIERDMDAVRALGLEVPTGRLPRIFPPETEIRRAKEWLDRLGLPRPLLILALGASRATKSWDLDRFAALAVEWAIHEGGGVLAVVSAEEMREAYQFLKCVDELLLLAVPETDKRALIRARITSEYQIQLMPLAALMTEAALVMGNDSGPRHIAVAVGTPTVTVFGPEDPFEWHPYPVDRHPYLFMKDLMCRRDAMPGMPPWCGLDVCTVERHQCMKLIGVDSVLQECRRVSRLGRASA